MNKFKNLVIFVLLAGLVLEITNTTAIAGSRKRRGTSGANELLIPVGSVATALGGANQALVYGADAIYWNPAGIARSPANSEMMFSRHRYIAGIDITYIAAMVNFPGLGAFAFSLKNLDFGDIAVTTTDNTDGTGELFSPSYIVGGISFSKVMTDRIAFGVTTKFISESIMRETASGIALDMGVQYSSGPGGYRLGVSLKNLGPNMKFEGPDLEETYVPRGTPPGSSAEPRRINLQDFELPSTLELGVGYEFLLDEQNTLTLSSNFLNNNFSLDEFKFGAEYSMNDLIFLRSGFNIGYMSDADDGEATFTNSSENFLWGPSFGAGLNYDLTQEMRINLEYALQTAKFFEDNQWITLTLLF